MKFVILVDIGGLISYWRSIGWLFRSSSTGYRIQVLNYWIDLKILTKPFREVQVFKKLNFLIELVCKGPPEYTYSFTFCKIFLEFFQFFHLSLQIHDSARLTEYLFVKNLFVILNAKYGTEMTIKNFFMDMRKKRDFFWQL